MTKKICFTIVLCAAVSISAAFGGTMNIDDLKDEIAAKAEYYLDQGRYDEAVEYFKKLSEEYPRIPYPYYYMGLAYYKKGDGTNAEKNLLKCIDLEPYYPEAYYHLSLIEYQKGNRKKVIEYLNEVTALDNTFQNAYYNRGVIFLLMDQPRRAFKDFSYALYLDPADKGAFVGLMQAAQKLSIVEMTEQDGDGKVRITVPKTGETPKPDMGGVSETKGQAAGTGMEISVSDNAGSKTVINDASKDTEISMIGGNKKYMEINFKGAANLIGKNLYIKIKGAKKNERVNISIRDFSTKKASYYISEITTDWKTFVIDLGRTFKGIDLAKAECIKIELMSPESITSEDSTVTIKDIEIK